MVPSGVMSSPALVVPSKCEPVEMPPGTAELADSAAM